MIHILPLTSVKLELVSRIHNLNINIKDTWKID